MDKARLLAAVVTVAVPVLAGAGLAELADHRDLRDAQDAARAEARLRPTDAPATPSPPPPVVVVEERVVTREVPVPGPARIVTRDAPPVTTAAPVPTTEVTPTTTETETTTKKTGKRDRDSED